MNVLQINARSLVNYERRFLLSNAISLCQPAVNCIYETWLNNKISDSELLLNDYLIFRSDRKFPEDKNPHGGTLIAIQNALNCRRLVLDDVDSCAICKIQVNKSKMFFCSFYNPPKTSPYRYSIEDFEKILSCIPKNCIAFVCGDLNFPNTNWANWTSTYSERNSELEFFKNRLSLNRLTSQPVARTFLMSYSTKIATCFQQMQMLLRKFSTVLTTLGSVTQSNYYI